MLRNPALLPSVVTIDVMPADASAEYAPAMVTACTEALAEGVCALASATPESTQPDAVALVLWQDDRFLEVTVRVGRHGSQWVARRLSFAETDPLTDRFTTVGLTVGTLVGERQPSTPTATAPALEPTVPAPTPPRASKTPAATDAVARGFELTADLAGLAGTAWQGGDWKKGVWGAARLKLGRSPLLVQVAGSYALSNGPELTGVDSLQSHWLSVGAGFGAQTTLPFVQLRGSALLELLFRQVTATSHGARGSDNELPVRVLVLGAWPARGPIAAVFGSALRVPLANPDASDTAHARQPLFELELLAGVEARL